MNVDDIVFLDIETTGLSLTNDRIVQFGMVIGDNHYNWLINPEIEISLGAFKVHKISNSDVKDKPTFRQVAENIFNLLDGKTIGTYNGNSFDIPIIIKEFKRCGIDWKPKEKIDVFNIWKSLENQKLTTCYFRFTGKKLDGAHDALEDIIGTRECYEKILELYPDVDIIKLSNSSTAIINGRLTFGKHNKKTLDQIPQNYLMWLYKETTDDILKDEIKKYFKNE